MKDRKFKICQRVIVKDFVMNSVRGDTSGEVTRYIYYPDKKLWKVEVLINSVYCFLDEDKLIDFDLYWEDKNGK